MRVYIVPALSSYRTANLPSSVRPVAVVMRQAYTPAGRLDTSMVHWSAEAATVVSHRPPASNKATSRSVSPA